MVHLPIGYTPLLAVLKPAVTDLCMFLAGDAEPGAKVYRAVDSWHPHVLHVESHAPDPDDPNPGPLEPTLTELWISAPMLSIVRREHGVTSENRACFATDANVDTGLDKKQLIPGPRYAKLLRIRPTGTRKYTYIVPPGADMFRQGGFRSNYAMSINGLEYGLEFHQADEKEVLGLDDDLREVVYDAQLHVPQPGRPSKHTVVAHRLHFVFEHPLRPREEYRPVSRFPEMGQ
ncbi:hypothetical protein JCM10212_003449 [Sporobolomyces blumeae]